MDKYLTDKKFWEKRAKKYDKLRWAKGEEYLQAFQKMCELKRDDEVLDLGTGTGMVAFSLCDKVKRIVGVDYSEKMLQEAIEYNQCKKIQFINADIRRMPFFDESFDLITARMVFHHVLWGTNRAISEVKRVLKPSGIFCLSEGVPPDRCVEDFYKKVFELKEKRKTFFPEDLGKLMKEGRFRDIRMEEFVMRHCSIKNWLENAGDLSNGVKKKIYQMHHNLHNKGKEAYNMRITPDDCFIDMKFMIVSGRK